MTTSGNGRFPQVGRIQLHVEPGACPADREPCGEPEAVRYEIVDGDVTEIDTFASNGPLRHPAGLVGGIDSDGSYVRFLPRFDGTAHVYRSTDRDEGDTAAIIDDITSDREN